MGKTVVFVHGAWVTPQCWEDFSGFFKSKGFECIAPAWPYRDKSVEELRRNPPAELAGLGLAEIIDHFDKTIRALPEPPLLIGHSFGGLFVQILLDRGLGWAGASIDSAPPKGVLPFWYPSVFKANLRILTTLGGWSKIIPPSLKDFAYGFVNTMPEAEQKAVYEKHVVPETGRIFFQTTAATFNDLTRVNFNNPDRGPLLLIAGLSDTICPPAQIRDNYRRYRNSKARTDYLEFAGRSHWIIAQKGWEEVAGAIYEWQDKLPR